MTSSSRACISQNGPGPEKPFGTQGSSGPARQKMAASRGFTLIEVLVAFMILAIALVVIMQLFSGSLKAGAVSADYFYGIFHAQEKMEEILARETLSVGTQQGEFADGYQWQVNISRDPLETRTGRELRVSRYKVLLEVKWEKGGRRRTFDLETVKLGPSPENSAESRG